MAIESNKARSVAVNRYTPRLGWFTEGLMYHNEMKKDLPAAETAADRDPTGRFRLMPPKSEGWDPFQVWRERIKQPRDLSGKTSIPDVPRKPQKS